MGRGMHVTPNQRQLIIDMRNYGATFKDISQRIGLSISACIKAFKHVKATGTTADKVRTRSRKTDARLDRIIHRISEADRHKTAVDVHREIAGQVENPVSTRTIQRRLTEFGLQGRVARKKPFISSKNKVARLKFAREHLNWTDEQWSKVLWTDESKFCSNGSDGKSYVRRRPSEEFSPRCTKATIKHDKDSIMVWGSMRTKGTGPLIRINGIMDRHVYVDQVLNKVVRPLAENILPLDWIFQLMDEQLYSALDQRKHADPLFHLCGLMDQYPLCA